jgi:hypothetical protein
MLLQLLLLLLLLLLKMMMNPLPLSLLGCRCRNNQTQRPTMACLGTHQRASACGLAKYSTAAWLLGHT